MTTIQKIANKIFVINRSQLFERYDPYYFRTDFQNLREQLSTEKFISIKDIILSWNRGDGPRDGFYTDDKENGVYFLRVNNLKNNTIDITDVKFINRSIHNTKLKRTQVKGGDLIFAISGTKDNLGTVSIVPDFIKEANLNSALIRIDLNKEIFTNEFFCLLFDLKFIRTQIEFTGKGAAQNNLNNNEINSIRIPKLSIIEQLKLVDYFQDAKAKQQQKQAQAKQLLESIDTYLLNELGIALQQQKYSAKDRIFISSFKEIVGSRIDPKLYDNTTKEIKNAISNAVYPKVALKELIIQSAAGDWGIEDTDTEIEGYTKCLVIRATEFDNKGNLTLNNSRVKYRLIKNEKLKSIDIKTSDLLIEKSGGSPDQPVGRVAIITQEYLENNQLGYSNFIHKIRLDESKVLPDYAFYFLKAVHNMKLTDAMQSQTNGIRNLIMSNYFNQSIVLPSIKKQKEIVKHIKHIQQQISQLQTEAVSILENAKAEVEKMILG